MTQKELLYLEDAYGHECNIIEICTETMNMLESDDLVSFIEKEIKKHEKMKKEIITKMEGLAHE